MDFNIEQLIKDRKEKDMSLRQLAEKYNVSTYTIKKYLNISGVNTSNKKISNKEIISLYNSGMCCREIAKKLYVSKTCINYRIKKYGKIRSLTLAKRNSDINHSFFSKFTSESCYWAGFIAADGCIRNGKQIAINLSNIDENHLKKFSKIINYKKSIKTKNNTSSLFFGSKELITNINKNFNIVPKKSLILEPPMNIPKKLIYHFIRGYIDGDGSYFYDKTKIILEILGTYKMLSWIKKNFEKNCKIGNPSIIKRNKIYYLKYAGNKQVPNILKWLFRNYNKNLVLDRKYNKIKKFL